MNKLIVIKKSTHIQLWIAFLVCIIFALSSCKENTILPPDLVPSVDNINTFQQDTFTVLSHTIYKDSLLTGGTLNNTKRSEDVDFAHAIGTIITGAQGDETYGKTIASVYVQVRQPAPSFAFSGTNQIFDSVILGINYLDSYGDTSTPQNQTFRIYRSADNWSKDSAYYETSTASISGSGLLNSLPINFNSLRKDSPLVNGVLLRPQLRFDLGPSFLNELASQTSTGSFKDYPTFLSWLGGFYIVPDSNVGNTLGYFDTDNTTMYVYYRFTNASNLADTAVAIFPYGLSQCNRFNNISRNYIGTPASNFIQTNATEGDSLIFIQGEPGLAGLITFPNIGDFPNTIINKAELTLTVVSPFTNYSDTLNFNIPDQLQLVYVNSNGEDEVLEDYIRVGVARVGGYRDWSAIGGMQRIQYKFNISHTIQNAVTLQNSNFALKISGARSNFPAQNRVTLRGSSSGIALEKPKLNIIFTKIQ